MQCGRVGSRLLFQSEALLSVKIAGLLFCFSLENTKINENLFCDLLTYSYL